MGDHANGSACDTFIEAFADDIIKKYRSPLLDLKFEDSAQYYVMGDGYPTWAVRLYAAVKTGTITDGKEQEEYFRIEGSPDFCPPTDDFISVVAKEFDLEEAEVKRRLQKADEPESVNE